MHWCPHNLVLLPLTQTMASLLGFEFLRRGCDTNTVHWTAPWNGSAGNLSLHGNLSFSLVAYWQWTSSRTANWDNDYSLTFFDGESSPVQRKLATTFSTVTVRYTSAFRSRVLSIATRWMDAGTNSAASRRLDKRISTCLGKMRDEQEWFGITTSLCPSVVVGHSMVILACLSITYLLVMLAQLALSTREYNDSQTGNNGDSEARGTSHSLAPTPGLRTRRTSVARRSTYERRNAGICDTLILYSLSKYNEDWAKENMVAGLAACRPYLLIVYIFSGNSWELLRRMINAKSTAPTRPLTATAVALTAVMGGRTGPSRPSDHVARSQNGRVVPVRPVTAVMTGRSGDAGKSNYGLVLGKPPEPARTAVLAEDPSPPVMARRRPGMGTPSAKEPDPDPAVKIVAVRPGRHPSCRLVDPSGALICNQYYY
ncbi:hypothetical protein FB45DRAFT_1011055 [Roridomyces roridus]|uniref:Uncharacterized protein n=1 Tax=Roridomyces roridus TaxID=1738132 RepID=A0AAD7FAZ6_9AGAR|nr:hypothetical protein FB45DRAFT_1011055 [Roridomyces roridus]